MANEIYKNGQQTFGNFTTGATLGSQIIYISATSPWTNLTAGQTLTGTGVGSSFAIKVPFINGATLTSYTFTYLLAGSARTPASGVLRTIGIYNDSSTNGTTLGLGGGSSVVYSPFSSSWTSIIVDVSSLNLVMDKTLNPNTLGYHLLVIDESGTGAVSGNQVAGFKFSYNLSRPAVIE